MAGEKLVQKALQAAMEARAARHVADPAERAANLAKFMEGNNPNVPPAVFHASKADVTSFDPRYKTQLSPFGFHFGTADQANFRTGQYDFMSEMPNVGKYHLSLKNPLEVTHMGSYAPDHLAETMMDIGILKPERYDALVDKHMYDPVPLGNDLVKILKKNGYDGLMYQNEREGAGYSFVPFDAFQSKSATGNLGTFDPKSLRLDENRGGEVREHHADGERVEYQSNSLPLIQDGKINWGDPESAADYVRASQAMMRALETAKKFQEEEPRSEPSSPAPVPAPAARAIEDAAPRTPVKDNYMQDEVQPKIVLSDRQPAPAPAPQAMPYAPVPSTEEVAKLTNRVAPGPDLTDRQRDLIVRTIAAESSRKTPEESRAIAHVILNRIMSGKYGATPEQVLFAKNQFEPWSDPSGSNYPMKISPTSSQYAHAAQALDAALGGEDITGGASNFWGPKAQAALRRPPPDFSRFPGVDIGETRFHRVTDVTPRPAAPSMPQQPAQPSVGLFAFGTNDAKPETALKSAQEIVANAQRAGIKPVFVLPNANDPKFAPISEALRKFAEEKGIEFEAPGYDPRDPLHITPKTAQEIAKKYPGAFVAGDSNSWRLQRYGYGRPVADQKSFIDPRSGVTLGRVGAGSSEIAKAFKEYVDSLNRGRSEGGEVEREHHAGGEFVGHVLNKLRAWHGSPRKFEQFDPSKFGTGEGQALYGKGMYFAGDKGRALEFVGNPEDRYRRLSGHMTPKEEIAFDLANRPDARDMDIISALAKKYGEGISFDEAQALATDAMKRRGSLYEVDINAPMTNFLDWNRRLSEQPEYVRNLLTPKNLNLREAIMPGGKNYGWVDETGLPVGVVQSGKMPEQPFKPDLTGNQIYNMIGHHDADRATNILRDLGITGNTYRDPRGFGTSDPTHQNFVVFDPAKDVEILNRYAEGGGVLSDKYPTHYLPNVGRQVMQEGGAPDPVAQAMAVLPKKSEEQRALDLANEIKAFESMNARIDAMPQREREMTHRPMKPTVPIEIEGGLIGKRNLGNAAYDVAGPLTAMAQGAYDLKTLPFYFSPFAPAAFATDIAEGVANKSPMQTALAAFGAPGKVAKAMIAPAVGASVLAPEEAQAAKLPKIGVPEFQPRKLTLQEIRRTFDPQAGINMSGEELDRLIDAYGKVAVPRSVDPELAAKGEAIAKSYITKGGSEFGGRSFFNQKPSVPLEELGSARGEIPVSHDLKPVVQKSWIDVARERAGSPMISLGGDLSNWVRLHAYGPKENLHALAYPTDIHAGFDFMREPNRFSVWANNPEHALMLDKQVQNQKDIMAAIKKDLPVMAVANPMGPQSIDSSRNMMDLVLSAIEGRGIHPEHLKAASNYLRSGEFGQTPKAKANYKERMADMPNLTDIDAARQFLLYNPEIAGTVRSDIVKGLERKDWVNKGFPEIGQLRYAATSPKFAMTPANQMGGRMVELDPRLFALAKENKLFDHFTYPGETAGKYYADVPLVHRQYGAPDVMDALMAKYNQWRPGATKSAPLKPPITVHPFSTDQSGRDTVRKLFEEQKQVQPINQRMLESIQRGEGLRSTYGFKKGGSVEKRALDVVWKRGSK